MGHLCKLLGINAVSVSLRPGASLPWTSAARSQLHSRHNGVQLRCVNCEICPWQSAFMKGDVAEHDLVFDACACACPASAVAPPPAPAHAHQQLWPACILGSVGARCAAGGAVVPQFGYGAAAADERALEDIYKVSSPPPPPRVAQGRVHPTRVASGARLFQSGNDDTSSKPCRAEMHHVGADLRRLCRDVCGLLLQPCLYHRTLRMVVHCTTSHTTWPVRCS